MKNKQLTGVLLILAVLVTAGYLFYTNSAGSDIKADVLGADEVAAPVDATVSDLQSQPVEVALPENTIQESDNGVYEVSVDSGKYSILEDGTISFESSDSSLASYKQVLQNGSKSVAVVNDSKNQIAYLNVYPGINMIIVSDGNKLERTFEVLPGALPSFIQIMFEADGSITKDEKENLVVGSKLLANDLSLSQVKGGTYSYPSGGFVLLKDGVVGIYVKQYDNTTPLSIK